MKTVMLHMKLPDDLAEAAAGKDLKAEVSAALRDRWFPSRGWSTTSYKREDTEYLVVSVDIFPTYGSIPAEQKSV